MDKVCIFSGDTENLNTSMSIVVDGQPITVWISDTHADEATPKKVKELYIEKYQKVDQEKQDLLRRAKELGLILVSEEDLASKQEIQSEPSPKPSPKTAPIPKPAPAPVEDDGEYIDAAKADGKMLNINAISSSDAQNLGVSGAASEYAIKSDTKSSIDLKAGEKVKIQRIRGRGGVDVAIPTKRIGPAGSTIIDVHYTSDVELQERFKAASRSDVPINYRDGYGGSVREVNCNLCNGKNPNCPKCDGMGVIEIIVK